MKKNENPDFIFARLCHAVKKMNNTPFSLETMRRKLRPFTKTTSLNGIVTFTLKGTDVRIKVLVLRTTTINYVRVISSQHKTITIDIAVTSNKDFLNKIIFKYHLLCPKN